MKPRNERKLTKRATDILNAVSKIEKWCQANLNDCSHKVFTLRKEWDTYLWNIVIYSASDGKLRLAIGDHSRWGAKFDDLKTGMSVKNYEYYMFDPDFPVNIDYSTRINLEGNLYDEKNLLDLIREWPFIKDSLLEYIEEEKSLSDFNA